MENELIEAEIINDTALVKAVEESGVEKQTGEMLIGSFINFFGQIGTWKKQAEAIVITDASQTAQMKIARTARLALRDIRLNADKKRKELKEDSLRYGRTVQSIYNLIEGAIAPIEKHLQEQEDFIAIQQAKKRAEIKAAREMDLQPYSRFVPFGLDLGAMSDADFDKLLNGARMQLQAEIEAAAKEEVERIAAEKAAAEEKERQRLENERLKKEADAMARELEAERKRAEAERMKREAEARAEQEKAAAALAAERAETKRLQDEIAAKAAAEAKAKKEAQDNADAELRAIQAAEKKANAAPDKAKLLSLAARIDAIEMPTLAADEGQRIIAQTRELLAKVTAYIRTNSDKL